MNGLNASPRKKLSSIPWVMIPPNVCATTDESQDDVELENLDGIEGPQERDVITFFRQFASNYSAVPLQPMAVVQSRYDAARHRRNKQAHSKSIKSWFRCHQSGPLHDLWWTSDIFLPDDVAATWNVNPVHRSGVFQLAKCEAELLSNITDGKDLLFDMCGEWRACPNAVQFKSKKGAQKSAALNLLIALDLGEQPDHVRYSPRSQTTETRNSVTVDDIISTCNEMSMTTQIERFRLKYIRYYGAVRNPGGKFVSNSNPCMVQCILSVEDVNFNDLNESCIEVSSDFHLEKSDSFNDAFDRLKCTMLARGVTVKDIDNMRSAMMVSRPNIEFEVTIPKWATAKIEFKFYLLELDFVVTKEGDEIPFSEAIGLDANAATRVGILCGCPVYDDGFNLRDRLYADFTLSSSVSVSDDNVRVKMINQTEVTFSEMTQQIERTSPEIYLRGGGCPVTLTKCFNYILFDEGKTYGMGGSAPFGDILKKVAENSIARDDRRSCMFVPLCARSSSKDIHSAKIEVDWKIVLDVVHHQPLTTAEGIPLSMLRNRFLIQPIGFKGRVFIAKNEEIISKNEGASPTTSTSPLFPGDMILLLPDRFKEKIIASYEGLELAQITYECFYEQTWKYSIRNAAHPLIAAMPLTGLSYEQHESALFHQFYGETKSSSTFDPSTQSSISNFLASRGLLVPELTHILPLPRDFLYLCRRASTFVGKLERNYLLHLFAWRFIELQDAVKSLSIPVSNTDLVPLIDKATRGGMLDSASATPLVRSHERLETLGDSVLLHFIVLNLFVQMHSTTTEFILDVFEQCVTNQGKNVVLYNAALQIGLHRLIDVGNSSSTKSWKAFFKAGNEKSTIELQKKKLSDTLESLIGATFLIDPSGCMTVGLLNEIGPCFPDKFAPGVKEKQSVFWFHGKGTCLTARYPFYKCPASAELEQIKCILERNHSDQIILQSKAAAFCHLLAKSTIRQDEMKFLQSDPISSLLLQSALYDESNPESFGLESLAKLRDKIFNVGNAALQLSIVSEIYHIYPTSTSGDIHLMKTILMSHDSLAYIFLKNGFHNCLFDENADATDEMKACINKADLLGSKQWAKNEGWVIHGGIKEFQRRVQQHGYNDCRDPQYMGLAAGRLIGHTKKLTDDAWEDLQFSMKAIVGAVVLSFGVKDAWDMFRPLFLELIMLSPDELRISFAGISDLVSVYQKGRR
ncbi:hypothetical protein ACHAXA_006127 [Cyclostephanos tholiformis]|uniref:RNase III domain-containing protein n=1 Tax=Cyclostephanos tholiformis TaxID=382380 RepID=A0ABD3RAG7_9STRA